MIKQTLVWTALPHSAAGAVAAGSELRLSLFVAPRLWDDDASVTKRPLSDYPDWLDWVTTVQNGAFEVEFEGGPTLPALADLTPLRADLWRSLFKPATDVIPFRFEDLSGSAVMSFPHWELHESLRDLYVRVASDPAYGAGADLPSRDVMVNDPTIVDIGTIAEEEPPFVPQNPDRGPVRIEPNVPPDPVIEEPAPEPGEPPSLPEGCREGCLRGFGCGCLLLPFVVVARLLRSILKAFGLLSMMPFLGSAFPPPPEIVSAQKAAFQQTKAYLEPTSPISEPLPSQEELDAIYDFHRMIAALGDYPLLMRAMGLVLDVTVTLPEQLPAAEGTVKVNVTLPTVLAATHYTPRTHYILGADQFMAQPRPGSDIANGLLRLDDTGRFHIVQADIVGGSIKLVNTANTLRTLAFHGSNPPNRSEDESVPSLQNAGLVVVRDDAPSNLRDTFRHSYALNAALSASDGSSNPPYQGAGAVPPASDELWADDIVRGYRVDIWDDQAQRWHSLCQRVGTYTFEEAEGGALTLTGWRDEGFVQPSVTEALDEESPRLLRAHDSLFTWNGWSLVASRPGDTILPDHSTGEAPNDPATPFKLSATFLPEPRSLPRLRFGYQYRVRVRVADLAGNSVFAPPAPLVAPPTGPFYDTQPEVAPSSVYRRFDPVSPPMVMLRELPKEGESLERLTVRSRVDDSVATITTQATERHLAPPKTSQLMAELHRKFDGTPAILTDQGTYDLASREAGSLTHRVNLATGDLEPIPGVQEIVEPKHSFWLQGGDTHEVAYLPDPHAKGVLLLGLPGVAGAETIIEPGGGVVVNKIPFDGAWPDLQSLRLRVEGLAAGEAPAQPAWDGVNHVLTVQVPQGESYVARLSSYFGEQELDRMGVWGWVEESNPPDIAALRATSAAGRTWLHLPYREIVLVHATQQPLAIPEVTMLTADKQLAETAATLDGTIAIDGKSTGKVDLFAEWTDPNDDPSKPTYNAATDRTEQRMQVAEIPAQEAVGDVLPVEGLRHALGDTKYHRVTYTPIASTRFREYFSETILADPQNLVRPLPGEAPLTVELDILNSARPDAPRPLYVLPLFEWHEHSVGDTRIRDRTGGGLRVYLERPWYSSGAGELLGAVVKIPGQSSALLRKYTSEWGTDPIWGGADNPSLRYEDFVNGAEVGLGLSLGEAAGLNVNVMGFVPQYDSDRNLWFADILMDPQAAYFPFVRLALARFQPRSVTGAHLSRVVLAEFSQLLPRRRVSYDLGDPARVAIQVDGPAPWREFARRSNVVIARIEQRQYADQSDELGWQVVAQSTLDLAQNSREESVWQGSVEIPQPQPMPMRVVVIEMEQFESDETRPGAIPGLAPVLRDDDLHDREGRVAFRPVFADAIEV